VDDPAASERLWKDGWLHTGDGARMDADGYIRITDRIKDVIKVGGEWISSLEIEDVLARHPSVAEAAVIGVPDAKWDEHPRAEVVLRPGLPAPTPRDLLRHLHAAVDAGALHQRALLTEVAMVESIPRTSVGKIDKKRMRAALSRNDAVGSVVLA
jgi:fatty-acyl-CoA synthase